ncbi:hypothetical protein C922_05257 [Plasmodium inui San Antonio 1]|uniref:Uncharacterized protein n=1 Tax=Plasmodium inui San Antonio 1 TaxID=1237626 RepID=W7A5I6_9APIC|nr:hypothetical protein C922_05257 [Plasmodium inui San Antonio 1]EUD64354.1 hypothetical protein C922_05257 [Plasmodium inui San Antonio 1]
MRKGQAGERKGKRMTRKTVVAFQWGGTKNTVGCKMTLKEKTEENESWSLTEKDTPSAGGHTIDLQEPRMIYRQERNLKTPNARKNQESNKKTTAIE